jgi:hypothetical protein
MRWRRRRQRQRHAQPGVASASGKHTTVGVEVETGLTTATTSHIQFVFCLVLYSNIPAICFAHDAELDLGGTETKDRVKFAFG